jgi:hypothetical protein
MDFEEIVKAVIEHNVENPDHKIGCPCMDTYGVQLYQIIAGAPTAKDAAQLRSVLRLALQWDALRNNPVTGPLPKIKELW